MSLKKKTLKGRHRADYTGAAMIHHCFALQVILHCQYSLVGSKIWYAVL